MAEAALFRDRLRFVASAAVARSRGRGIHRGRRPTFTLDKLGLIDQMIQAGASYCQIEKATRVCRRTIGRIIADRPWALRALARWA